MTTRFDFDSSKQTSSPVIDRLSSGVLDKMCEIWAANPGQIIIPRPGTGRSYTTDLEFLRQGYNEVCTPQRPQIPPPPLPNGATGKCVGATYRVDVEGTREVISNGQVINTLPFQAFQAGRDGEIAIVGQGKTGNTYFTNIRYGIGVLGNNGEGIAETIPCFIEQEEGAGVFGSKLVSYTVNFVLLSGADNCGKPADRTYPVTPPISLPINIPVTIAPDVTIPVAVNNLNIDVGVSLNVDIGVNIEANIDFGGVTINLGGSGGGGNVDLSPVLDATGQILSNQGVMNTSLNDLLTARLRFVDYNVVVASCDGDGNVTQKIVNCKTLADYNGNSLECIFDELFAEIYGLRTQGIIDCASEFDPVEIVPETTVEIGDVLYSAEQEPPTRGYLIEITNFDAAEFRTYKLSNDEDIEAGFGNVSIVSSNFATFGDVVFMRTRRLVLDAREVDVPHRIRVSLKPGIAFRIVNLGYNKR